MSDTDKSGLLTFDEFFNRFPDDVSIFLIQNQNVAALLKKIEADIRKVESDLFEFETRELGAVKKILLQGGAFAFVLSDEAKADPDFEKKWIPVRIQFASGVPDVQAFLPNKETEEGVELLTLIGSKMTDLNLRVDALLAKKIDSMGLTSITYNTGLPFLLIDIPGSSVPAAFPLDTSVRFIGDQAILRVTNVKRLAYLEDRELGLFLLSSVRSAAIDKFLNNFNTLTAHMNLKPMTYEEYKEAVKNQQEIEAEKRLDDALHQALKKGKTTKPNGP